MSTWDIPLDREETALPDFSHKEIGNFYFWLVAICHQTSPPGVPPLAGSIDGRELRGWDYLRSKFQAAASNERRLLVPPTWAEMTGLELASLFRDPAMGDRLTEPDARAELVRNLGQTMLRRNWRSLDDLYQLSKHRVATGEPNLLGLLAKFRAYDDPVHKKSYFLLSLMRNSGVWQFSDNDRLGPPVDYHEVRGHLRIGTVSVNDPELRKKLLNGEPVDSDDDIAIRMAVHDAIMLLSELTGLKNPSQLHYLFWNVFRSCCTRESPHCLECAPGCGLPVRYVQLAIQADGSRHCPFAKACESAGYEPKYREHVFATDYY